MVEVDFLLMLLPSLQIVNLVHVLVVQIKNDNDLTQDDYSVGKFQVVIKVNE